MSSKSRCVEKTGHWSRYASMLNTGIGHHQWPHKQVAKKSLQSIWRRKLSGLDCENVTTLQCLLFSQNIHLFPHLILSPITIHSWEFLTGDFTPIPASINSAHIQTACVFCHIRLNPFSPVCLHGCIFGWHHLHLDTPLEKQVAKIPAELTTSQDVGKINYKHVTFQSKRMLIVKH